MEFSSTLSIDKNLITVRNAVLVKLKMKVAEDDDDGIYRYQNTTITY